MKKLLKTYEETICLLDGRIKELKNEIDSSRHTVKELNSLNTRIDLLKNEKYDLMRTAAQIRIILEPKPITPSLAARHIKEGDAS